MSEAEYLCDRIAFLRKGQLVALDTHRGLKDLLKMGTRVVISYDGIVDLDKLKGVLGVIKVISGQGKAELILENTKKSLGRVVKLFAAADITDIGIEEPDLEDTFHELAK